MIAFTFALNPVWQCLAQIQGFCPLANIARQTKRLQIPNEAGATFANRLDVIDSKFLKWELMTAHQTMKLVELANGMPFGSGVRAARLLFSSASNVLIFSLGHLSFSTLFVFSSPSLKSLLTANTLSILLYTKLAIGSKSITRQAIFTKLGNWVNFLTVDTPFCVGRGGGARSFFKFFGFVIMVIYTSSTVRRVATLGSFHNVKSAQWLRIGIKTIFIATVFDTLSKVFVSPKKLFVRFLIYSRAMLTSRYTLIFSIFSFVKFCKGQLAITVFLRVLAIRVSTLLSISHLGAFLMQKIKPPSSLIAKAPTCTTGYLMGG